MDIVEIDDDDIENVKEEIGLYLKSILIMVTVADSAKINLNSAFNNNGTKEDQHFLLIDMKKLLNEKKN